MRSIHKYDITHENVHILYGDVLDIQYQNNALCVWAIYDDEKPGYRMNFHTVGTGMRLPQHLSKDSYLKTVQRGPFVWHIFGEKSLEKN